MNDALSIALIGCGKMGSALLRGWLASGIAAQFYVLEPSGLPPEFSNRAIYYIPDASSCPPSDIFVLAVKPQIMEDVCVALRPAVSKNALILSIAAGQTTGSFEKRFGKSQPVIRAMPNTPAAIGKGITVAVANAHVSAAQKQVAEKLLKAGGAVEWIDDERLMDSVTALSGSGPAYVFLLIEMLAKAGEKSGLPAAAAMTLARQTVVGAAALAEADGNISAEELRKNVTSPGGTTEAALKILMDGRLQMVFDEALKTATARSKELSA